MGRLSRKDMDTFQMFKKTPIQTRKYLKTIEQKGRFLEAWENYYIDGVVPEFEDSEVALRIVFDDLLEGESYLLKKYEDSCKGRFYKQAGNRARQYGFFKADGTTADIEALKEKYPEEYQKLREDTKVALIEDRKDNKAAVQRENSPESVPEEILHEESPEESPELVAVVADRSETEALSVSESDILEKIERISETTDSDEKAGIMREVNDCFNHVLDALGVYYPSKNYAFDLFKCNLEKDATKWVKHGFKLLEALRKNYSRIERVLGKDEAIRVITNNFLEPEYIATLAPDDYLPFA